MTLRLSRDGVVAGSTSEAARLLKRNRVVLNVGRRPPKRLPQNCRYCGGFNGKHRTRGGLVSDRVRCGRCEQYRCPVNLLADGGCTVCVYVEAKKGGRV